MSSIYTYHVEHPGEAMAGISPYNDTVRITLESGDPGGEPEGEDSFGEMMRLALTGWYDGAGVALVRVD